MITGIAPTCVGCRTSLSACGFRLTTPFLAKECFAVAYAFF